MSLPCRTVPCLMIATLLCAVAPGVVRAQNSGSPARSAADMRTSVMRAAPGSRRAQDSMADSVRRIERNAGGRVLSVERMHAGGRDLNRVKVMDDSGRVRIYVDDPGQRRRGAGNRARGDDD